MLVLMLPHVSSRVSGFSCGLAVSMGEAAKPLLPFRTFPTVKIGGSLARNARFDATTCLVSSLWFSCGFAVSMGAAAKILLFGGFQGGCSDVLFCVAGVALCDIPTCGHNTFATFSHDELQFSWQAQHFGRVYRHFAWQSQHFRSVVLRLFPNA